MLSLLLPLFVVVISIAAATWAGWELWRSPLLSAASIIGRPSRRFIQRQVRYQAAFFCVALAVAVFASALAVQRTGPVFAIGNLDFPARVEVLDFIRIEGWSWIEAGCLLTLGFGLATCVLMSPSLLGIADWPELLRNSGCWIIVLSGVNALSEELIYRGALVAVAEGRLAPAQTALLSAVIFALAHLRGQAFGFTVVAGSAAVGWVLAYAVLQTHGLFWAWCIHFVQDVVIFASLIASTTNPLLDAESPSASAQSTEFKHLS